MVASEPVIRRRVGLQVVMMNVSRNRQQAEDMFRRIQKSPVVPAENSSQAGRRAQDFKTARLRELRLAKEAGEKARSDHNERSR
jgi:hypothetical protein